MSKIQHTDLCIDVKMMMMMSKFTVIIKFLFSSLCVL